MGVVGRDTVLGLAEEAAFGTYQAPTDFLEFTSESVTWTNERMESGGLRSGRKVLLASRRRAGREGVEGDIGFEVMDRMPLLPFKHMFGAVSSSQPDNVGAPLVWEHEFTLGSLDGLSLSIVKELANGDVFAYLGCKVAEWELSNEVDGFLMCSASIDGVAKDDGQAAPVETYVDPSEPLAWVDGTVTLDGTAYEVSSVSLSGNNAIQNDRYAIRGTSSAQKREQVQGVELVNIEGEFASDYEDSTVRDLFSAGTIVPITAKWEGDLIEDVYNFAVEVTLPTCQIDGDDPSVGGADLIEQPVRFKVLDDGVAEPITVKVTTTVASV